MKYKGEKMSALLDKIKKTSTIKETAVLAKSKFFNRKDMIPTAIPIINVALSGQLDGGLTPGLTMFAGPSKNFKTGFSLLMAKAYLEKYEDAVLLFYDSEFGTPQSYFDSFGIDTERVVHSPITDIEQLKFDIMTQIENIERGDHIIILVDSIGNLASKKEVADALDQKSVADFTRAKQLKSLFRMVTPHLTLKDIPMVVVNHTYKTIETYAKDQIGGGCLVEGTKIKLADGSLIEIQNVKPNQIVQTMVGPRQVTHTWTPETLVIGEPECYKITFEDDYEVVCSDEHEFLIDGKWVYARDLKLYSDVTVY